jgi:hypothetical protein
MKLDRSIEQGATPVSQGSCTFPLGDPDIHQAKEQSSALAIAAIGLGVVLTIIWCGSLAAGLFWVIF